MTLPQLHTAALGNVPHVVPAALIVVGSLAASFAVFASLPPDTVAVFVTSADALVATFTDKVIAG
jgi:hypothetical protein